ncbi:MAG: PEP-CTERM sorting domain-containing protein, partial [Burkholderiaceae bacterium]
GGLSGRFVTGNYDVFNNSLGQPGCGSLGSIVNAGSPLMTGVSSLDSGYGANCNRVTLKAGATLVASWSTGQPMAATRTDHAAPVVGINLYPVSSSVSAELWNASTDGARLFANALNYVGAAPLAVVPEPGSLALAGLAVLAAFTVRRRRA